MDCMFFMFISTEIHHTFSFIIRLADLFHIYGNWNMIIRQEKKHTFRHYLWMWLWLNHLIWLRKELYHSISFIFSSLFAQYFDKYCHWHDVMWFISCFHKQNWKKKCVWCLFMYFMKSLYCLCHAMSMNKRKQQQQQNSSWKGNWHKSRIYVVKFFCAWVDY